MSYPDFPPPRTPVAPASPYQLTREEKRVLKECNQESFYRRCVPFMTAFGLGAYYGVHLGYMKGHVNYGSAPKVAVGLIIGFVTGKLSYKSACEEKILRLPGGRLKESILTARRATDNLWGGTTDDGGLYTDATISYAMPPYTPAPFSSYDSRPGSDLDNSRQFDTFDDSFKSRRTEDFLDDTEHTLPTTAPSQLTSYDELRNRNRDEYEVKRRQFRPAPSGDYAPYGSPYPPSQSTPSTDERFSRAVSYQPVVEQPNVSPEYRYSAESTIHTQPRVPIPRKNFYGDTIDK